MHLNEVVKMNVRLLNTYSKFYVKQLSMLCQSYVKEYAEIYATLPHVGIGKAKRAIRTPVTEIQKHDVHGTEIVS